MRRPALSDATFFAHLFSPRKNPKPTGLRHRILKGTKGQRVARINAYNKMPAEKQAVIDRAGNRESFLRGEVTFTDSKRKLRETAVQLGIVKPVRQRMPPISKGQQVYDQAVVEHLKDEGLDSAEHWNERNVRKRLAVTKRITKRDILASDRATLRRQAARRPSDFEDDGYDFNPYWYH
jgi:hypothetical protein